jgi:WD40 repeat protein
MKGQAFLEPRAQAKLDDYVVDLAWSPDSTAIAVAGGEGQVALGSFGGEALALRTIGEHPMGVLAVAWQPRGARSSGDRFATSGQDGALVLWGADGATLRRLRPGVAATEHLAFHPDGGRLASAAGKSVTLWSADGDKLLELPPHDATVAALAWDKPGRDLGVALNGGLMLHRFEAAQPTRRALKWDGAALSIAFSPNGKAVAAGMQDGSVHFWYLATGRDSQMRGYPGRVSQTIWSHNGRYLATAAADATVVWDFGGKGPEGTRPLQLQGHTDRIEAMAFQPAGPHLVTGGRDWRVALWLPGKATQSLDAHLADAEVSAIRWAPDNRHVAVGERQGAVTIYELVQATR